MANYKNFKTVIYCPAQWVIGVTMDQLKAEYEFFAKNVPFDKVYLEPYRGGDCASRKKLLQIKEFLESKGIEVSGGLTTTTKRADLIPEKEYKKQRLFSTYCYNDADFKKELVSAVKLSASIFDEIILDDFYFTNCTCEDCIKAKGDKSWQEYRLALMKHVSEEIIVKPAKKINPKIKMVIKYPNWMESYAETGYNPGEQPAIFDGVYTGTETRNAMDTDQTLPRYLSYSLVRWMENLAPGRNGGGWFDAFQCYPMDDYLEQAYLTVFSKAKEVMLFAWPYLVEHRFVPTLGFQLKKLDELMTGTGKCVGISEYHPVNAQGEDHLADYLGLLGIPFEPTPNFGPKQKTIFITAACCADKDILSKLEKYVRNGGRAIVTSGFVKQNLGKGIEQMTSIRYRDRKFVPEYYQYKTSDSWFEYKVPALKPIEFPLMEHRNNSSWNLLKGMTSEKNCPILIRDTYGKGQMITFVVPDDFSNLQELPKEVLNSIKDIFCEDMTVSLECGRNIGLFTYSNNTFVTYAYQYMNEGVQPCFVKVKGGAKALVNLDTKKSFGRAVPKEILPYTEIPENPFTGTPKITVFKIITMPDEFAFWKIKK